MVAGLSSFSLDVRGLVGGGKLAGLLDLHYLVAAMCLAGARFGAQDRGATVLTLVTLA